jgi:WD40 repeat protein
MRAVTRMALVAFVAAAIAGVAFEGRAGGAVPAVASTTVPKSQQVFVVGADGQGLRQLSFGPVWHSLLLWTLGGRAVADVAFTGSSQREWIESRLTNGSGHRKLSATVSTPFPTNMAFSAASGLTAVVSCCHDAAFTLEAVGPPGSQPRVLDSWSNSYNAGSLLTAWSPNGRLIAYLPVSAPTGSGPGSWAVAVIAPDGKRRRILVSGLADNNVSPLFSPDGRAILFCGGTPRAGLYTVPTSGGQVHRITHGDCGHDVLAWSPNGREIAYIRPTFHGRHANLFVVNVRTGQLRRLAGRVQDYGALAWSPDGKKIAFAGSAASSTGSAVVEPAVETINVNGTGLRDLVRIRGYGSTFGLAWSADSRQIAFTAGPGPYGY